MLRNSVCCKMALGHLGILNEVLSLNAQECVELAEAWF